jgi:hypothetical protein
MVHALTNGAQAADLALQGGTPIYVKQFMKDHGFPEIHDGADGIKLN